MRKKQSETKEPIKNPADMLLGQKVNQVWKVIEKLNRPEGATGGCFSIGYIIQDPSGRKAFLKALDYSSAFDSPDPAKALQGMVEAFNFERDVLATCRLKKMSRVVATLEEGKIELPGAIYPVQFIIFELADGDVRSHPKAARVFDIAWTLRALHHIAVGLWQLHGHGIAHQDLKPSNVLIFKGDQMKVADLGRAERLGATCPFSNFLVPGAQAYAPPELLYGEVQPDWKCRRYGCDLYLMGSMIVFFFCGIQMTALLRNQLRPSHVWDAWPHSYRDVLPYIRDAFGKAMEEIEDAIPGEIREDIAAAIAQLCEPDPRLRGHPNDKRGFFNPYSLERYISLFDRLGKRAELGLLASYRLGN